MKVKAGVTGAAISFMNLVEISSGSVALCWFRPCSSLYTPFWMTIICGASLYGWFQGLGCLRCYQLRTLMRTVSSAVFLWSSDHHVNFSFRGAISEFSHFLFLMKVKSFLFLESWLEDIMHDPEGETLCLLTLGHISAYNIDNTILLLLLL